jgi:hypothetical protein
MSEKKKRGRPPKGLDVLPNGWQDTMIDLASQGASQSELQDTLGIDDNLWYKFIDREPEFRDTFARAKRSCKAWWERHGRINLENPHFNNGLWAFNMKNRFRDDWGDSSKVQVDANVKAKVDSKIELVTRDKINPDDIGFTES